LHPYTNVHYIKTLHFAIQTCPKLASTISNTTLCYTNMSKISVHYIKHYTFPMQNNKNCVPIQVSTTSKHYTFPMQTCQNCVHTQSVHYIKTLHFSYANMSKLCPYTSVHYIKTNTTLLLHKKVKIVSISKCPPYQKHYTFPMQTCQNCVHTQVSTISKQTLHFCYANMSKLCPYTYVHHIKHYTFPMQNHKKLCPYTNVYHVNPLHFATPRCQNCVHKHLSTILKTLHISYTNTSKLRPYADAHYIK
jgi:hypothetical protein